MKTLKKIKTIVALSLLFGALKKEILSEANLFIFL